MPQDRILIKFQAKGDTALERSILKIAKAQAILEGNSRKLALATNALNTSSKKLNKGLLELNGSQRLVSTNFATLRSKLLLASFGFAIFSQAVLKFVNAAAAYEETLNKFNVVFGHNADEVHKWAGSLSASVGRAKSDIMGFSSSLQDIFVPMGFLRSESAELSKGLTELAIDVASFNDASDADVLNAFKSAIVGNHRSVLNYGIKITEAAIEQEALSSGIIDSARALTEQEKVLARVNLLVEGSRDAWGDAEETAGSYTNRLKNLNAQWKMASEQLGRELMPALSGMLNVLTDLIPVFTFLSKRVLEISAVFLVFQARVAVTAIRMKALSIWTGKAVVMNNRLKASLGRTLWGAAIIGIGELIHQFDLLGDEAEELDQMEIVPDYSKLSDFAVQMNRTKLSASEYKKMLDDLDDQIKEQKRMVKHAKEEGTVVFTKVRGKFVKETIIDPKEIAEEEAALKKLEAQRKEVVDKQETQIQRQKVAMQELLPSLKEETAILELKTRLSGPELQIEIHRLKNKDEWAKLSDEAKENIKAEIKAQDEHNKTIKENADAIKEATENKEKAEREAEKSLQKKQQTIKGYKDELAILRLRDKHTGEALKVEEKLLAIQQSGVALTEEELKALKETLQEIEKIKGEIEEAKEEAEQLKLSLEEALAVDAIVAFGDAFSSIMQRQMQEGKFLISDFADYFTSQLYQALADFVKNKIFIAVAELLGGKSAIGQALMLAGGGSLDDFHSGGMISSYQSGGNVPIMAQEGEFVMQRSAVESMGVENLNRMNRTGQASGGVNINFTGNVLSRDFIEDEAVPLIKNALRKGGDLGLA